MKWIASILLLGVFIRHDAVTWIAQTVHMTPAAVFYILGGIWEVTLCAVLLMVFWAMRASIWKNLAIAAMLIGILEGAQVSICRMCISDIRQVPPGTNLCDYVSGLPVGISLTCLYFLILCWSVGHAYRTA